MKKIFCLLLCLIFSGCATLRVPLYDSYSSGYVDERITDMTVGTIGFGLAIKGLQKENNNDTRYLNIGLGVLSLAYLYKAFWVSIEEEEEKKQGR